MKHQRSLNILDIKLLEQDILTKVLQENSINVENYLWWAVYRSTNIQISVSIINVQWNFIHQAFEAFGNKIFNKILQEIIFWVVGI